MVLIGGKWVEGERVLVRIDKMNYSRMVRFNKIDGLYIVVANRKYFEYEFDIMPCIH